jgi:Fic family protein
VVSIIKQRKGNQTYYYLTHHDDFRTKRKYLGKTIPTDIESIKKEFLLEFYREGWQPKLEQMQKQFIANRKKMPKSALVQELKSFVVSFTYHTQKIEGSSLTRLDTIKLLRDGITPSGKPKSDMIEAELAEQVFFEMLEHKRQISLDTIRYWHTRMFNKTKLDIAGQLRDYEVYVHGSKVKFPQGDKVYDLMQEFFVWYYKTKGKINSVELAALTHLKFESIHPFGDGNGRVGRLLMNCILDEGNYPMLNILYSQRNQYYGMLQTSNLKDDESLFLKWFVNLYIKNFHHNQNITRKYLNQN